MMIVIRRFSSGDNRNRRLEAALREFTDPQYRAYREVPDRALLKLRNPNQEPQISKKPPV